MKTETNVIHSNRFSLDQLIVVVFFALAPIRIFRKRGHFRSPIWPWLHSLSWFTHDSTEDDLIAGFRLASPYLPFLFWAILNSFYYLVARPGEWGPALGIVQLFYGIFLLNLFGSVFTRYSKDTALVYLLPAITLVCLLMPFSGFTSNERIRQSLSFSNPNQLAYHGTLVMYMICVFLYRFIPSKGFRSHGKIATMMTLAGIVIFHFLIAFSLSRAGIMGLLIFDGFLVFWVLDKRPKLVLGLVSMVGCILLVIFCVPFTKSTKASDSVGRLHDRFTYRFEKREVGGDLVDRTIGRLRFETEIDILFGDGGRIGRWDENVPVGYVGIKEVHNSLLEILNSYGVIGFCLFLSGCLAHLLRSRFRVGDFLLFLPILLYNMSHNGFRYRLLWVALAFSSVIYAKKGERSAREA